MLSPWAEPLGTQQQADTMRPGQHRPRDLVIILRKQRGAQEVGVFLPVALKAPVPQVSGVGYLSHPSCS